MPRPPDAPPTQNEHGDDTHPAWGLIGASRVSQSPPGATLFDSDIHHHHYVVVRLGRATRSRSLMRDMHFGREQIVEIAMSEAQWASFVSSMNVGQGVPCTLLAVDGELMPGLVHEPRLAETMDEVRNATQEAMRKIEEAFAAYEEKKSADNLRTLRSAIKNVPANMVFAAESLSEHAENVVQRARADIEAMVTSKAVQLGIDPAEVAETRLLDGAGPD